MVNTSTHQENNWYTLSIASKNLLKQALDMNPNEAWPYIIFADNYCKSDNERFTMLLKAWQIDPTNLRCSQTLEALSHSATISHELVNQYHVLKNNFISQHQNYAIPIKYSPTNSVASQLKIDYTIANYQIIFLNYHLYNKELDFIIDYNWQLHLGYSHKFLSNNHTFVYGAGTIKVDLYSKKIVYIDNKSGHFQPTCKKLNEQIFPFLYNMCDLNTLQIMYFDSYSDSAIGCGNPPVLYPFAQNLNMPSI